MPNAERTTRAPARARNTKKADRVHALTIASHPELGRIGHRVDLPALSRRGRELLLSRNTPDFSEPGKVWGEPLGDVFLSRAPIRLARASSGGVVVSWGRSTMGVRISGEPLLDVLELEAEEVARGVDMELGDRVALVLHLAEPGDELRGSSFGLVGESDAIRETRRAIRRVADLDVTVLLRGESGTGKELVARAIHENGPRTGGPFVAVNLSAITPSLAASELFGAVKGAYTGAVADRKGLFVSANGGTLFLDEVGDCPVEVQAMLLRALETSEIYPVGARNPRRVDVRLVAATDSDLESKAQSGAFKEPLLHRLSTYEIWMTPLRDRPEDIGRLMVHFAAEARRSFGEALPRQHAESDDPPWIPAELAARSVRYGWPGNVRQLRNLIWQIVIDGRGSKQLEIDARARRLFDGRADKGSGSQSAEKPDAPPAKRRPGSISEDELEEAMARSAWNVTEAARLLGISRASLYELIRKSPRIRTADQLEAGEIREALETQHGDVARAAAALHVSSRGMGRRMKRLGIEV